MSIRPSSVLFAASTARSGRRGLERASGSRADWPPGGLTRVVSGPAEGDQEFFRLVSNLDGPGPLEPTLVLSDQDKLDIVTYLKLLR